MSEATPDAGGRKVGALRIRVRGVVQGVGFRPFVHRLARRYGLSGWVYNGEQGVDIHIEGSEDRLRNFVQALRNEPPPAADITGIEVAEAQIEGSDGFAIRLSRRDERPTTRISPDLPVCADCLRELADPADRRHRYPYINCTNCGPRYSIILALPYDRPRTTMRDWPLCPDCAREYADPTNRRFHAQPVACPVCGPAYALRVDDRVAERGPEAIERAARMLADGRILAVKGLGGYHLACDARNDHAVRALRRRKFRKEKPFAVMARDLPTARALVNLDAAGERLLTGIAQPIVLAPARVDLPGVAPENPDLGVMLPYTPVHHLLFEAGTPEALVMTSANRSSEPIAYRDDDAFDRLAPLADAFLVGERPIARRVDDSVAQVGPWGAVVLRRARGYAPGAVAALPVERPILALGADLKNTVTLVVDGQAFVSQHLGDLDQYEVEEAFRETIEDLTAMYDVSLDDALVVHDAHPEYRSTRLAAEWPGEKRAVQHHRAHIASVAAERGAWETPVVGMAFDGTGYGDDGGVWGGAVFVGCPAEGYERVAHLREAVLPGGDAAARVPVQAAAGFLGVLDALPDFTAPPFAFPDRYRAARKLVDRGVRTFPTTSVGRLFDTVAAVLGFTRPVTFEGQAAIWLEHMARGGGVVEAYPFPPFDYEPVLRAVVEDRLAGRSVREIARAFHAGLAQAVVDAAERWCETCGTSVLALSGGVFQNQLLLREIAARLDARRGPVRSVWVNRRVPPNDGGISLGQAALGACRTPARVRND